MSKMDVEEFYDFTVALVRDNIDAKIDAINAEKGDTLLQKPTSGQFVSDVTEQVLAHDFFLFYTMAPSKVLDNAGPNTSLEITMMFYVVFVDPAGGSDSFKKAVRYTRALAEIFKDNYDSYAHSSDFELVSHIPQSAQFENSSEWYKIGGIEIKGAIVI